MFIADAIARSSSEHEVYFLLTAYLEAVRFGDRHGLLPDGLTRLPLGDRADLRGRLVLLCAGPVPAPVNGGRLRTLLSEARQVMESADHRLAALDGPALRSAVRSCE